MKNFQIIVTVALSIILIMNYNLTTRVKELENQLVHISLDQHQIINTVHGQTSNIQNIINDIREEQSWISHINIDVETLSTEEQQILGKFEWQIKELPSNAEVVFNYSVGNNGYYTTIPAEEIQNGLFQVLIPFETDLEPRWHMSRAYSQQRGMVVEEYEEMVPYTEEEMRFFVSMSFDGMVKSGNQQVANIGHYATNYYGTIFTHIHTRNEEVTIDVTSELYDSPIPIEKVYLLKYQNGELINEIQMLTDQDPNNNYRPFHFWLDQPLETGTFTRLVIKAVYNNGETFEKEVYPH
ncbi:hypothetical protein J2S74_002198 [Evansella vedderi]|uniref:Regulatory protein YycH-like domain-containing protein n=1 Tax=Evansella vedderi TaxID=38282 RepID=A0ABT9ZUA3_9BACI|nr:hypothetical protein [Evansella vedderi]MDQ0254819.1 hypothetical protein [Evansella vedderi]